MGAGRKTQTFTLSEGIPSSATVNCSVSARHLRKCDLGGVIFGCKHSTMNECLSNQLFGLPAPHFSYVKNIDSGLPLFLFNYTDRKLHGIYESASSGSMNINPYGWTSDGSERTPYPAQVRIRIRTCCQPLLENQFRSIINDNFYSPSHFWFELDHAQVAGLITLFTSAPSSGNAFVPMSVSKWTNPLNMLPNARLQSTGSVANVSSSEWMKVEGSRQKKNSVVVADTKQRNKFEMLSCDGGNNDYSSSSKTSSMTHEDDLPAPLSEWDSPDPDQANGSSCDHGSGEIRALRHHSDEDTVLLKLRQLVAERACTNSSLKDHSDDAAATNMIADMTGEQSLAQPYMHCEQSLSQPHVIGEQSLAQPSMSAEKFEKVLPVSSDLNADIVQTVELQQAVEELKTLAQEQLIQMKELERKQVASDREIQQLRERVKELESKLCPSTPHVESLSESLDNLCLDPRELIFLIGGYDGVSWLSALDAYSPSRDMLTSLRPMSSARSYASAVVLNGDIYIFGGGNGELWYNTVECYNQRSNKWSQCPPLVHRRGSLAGATLQEKIFAIGGGSEEGCFSDVEMFDPLLGRWIEYQPMLQKRFATAAVELNGALYAVGGFDGNDYLNSVERLDPREVSWTRLENMKLKRGCHSLVVLNEKIYALGGYNGNAMESSVEVFDPRIGSWMMGDSLNHSRGYAATAVLGDSMYAIGGRNGRDILDIVECYKEGVGWQVTNSNGVGRCFFSAIVL